MSFSKKLDEALRCLTYSTALTAGAPWNALRIELVDAARALEQRLAALDTPVERPVLALQKKK